MFKFILQVIFQQDSMHNSTLDLFCNDDNNDEIADEYAMEIEMKAAMLEVTVDYYMMEFM